MGTVASIAEAKVTPGTVDEILTAARAKIAEEKAKFNKPTQEEAKLSKPTLPVVMVNDRQLRSITTEAVAALHAANNPPEIFMRMGELVRVQADENGRPIIKELSEAGVRYHLTQAANFMHETKKKVISVSPPRDLVQNVMAAPSWPFPALKGIVEVPVLRRDGSILATPGYDSATRLYYRPAPGLTIPSILVSPEQKHVKEAASFISNELLGDFPFVDQASMANAIAALLTPIVRHVIDGPAPAAVNTATKAGTGKSMLNEIIGMVATGSWMAMLSPPMKRDSDEEWSKIITSILLKGATTACFDNCDGLLKAPSLASVLTAKIYSGRILGKSKPLKSQ